MRSRITAAFAITALALAINGAAPAAVATGGTSNPSALAILNQAEAMLNPAPVLRAVRALIGNAPTPRDGTPTMVALARMLPGLNSADQARARVLLRTTPPNVGTDACGATSNSLYKESLTDDGHFVIYYTSDKANPNYSADAYVDQVETVLAKVWSTEIGNLRYPAPKTPLGFPPATPIFLCNLNPDLYGYCSGAGPEIGVTSAAICTLRNSYDLPEFTQNGTSAQMALQVTAAHEFFHAVQFGMNANTPMWPAEGSAVWMENEVFPASRDYLQYMGATGIQNPLVPFNVLVSPVDSATGANWTFTPYGDGIFFRFLATWLRDKNAVRDFWTYLANHPKGLPINAVISVVNRHHRVFPMAMMQWAIWNTLPPSTYPDRALYTPVAWWKDVTRGRLNRGFASGSVVVSPLADAPVRIHRGIHATPSTRLRITVIGPAKARGGWFTYQVRKVDGTHAVSTSAMPANGRATISVPFDTSVSDVVITLNSLALVKRTFQVRTEVVG